MSGGTHVMETNEMKKAKQNPFFSYTGREIFVRRSPFPLLLL
jgi:hypothetical protein